MGEDALGSLDFGSEILESEFDTNYGLLAPEQTVLVRAYSDDTDDRILSEVKPKFIVMVEPDMDFVRRIEVKNAVFLAYIRSFLNGIGLQKLASWVSGPSVPHGVQQQL